MYSQTFMHERHVVLDEQDAAATLAHHVAEHLVERRRLVRSSPNDGSSSRRTSKGPARHRASSTSRRWPVDSAPACDVGQVGDAAQLEGRHRRRRVSRALRRRRGELRQRPCAGQARLPAERDVLGHGQRVAELHALERSAEPEPAAGRRAAAA